MKKFLRALFSRPVIVGLSILIQLSLLVWLVVAFNMNSFWFLLAAYIISILVVIGIIGKDEIPEFKLPWIILVLVLPGVGSLFYALFSHIGIHGQNRKILIQAHKSMLPYLKQNEEVVKEAEKADIDAGLQANYIYKACGMSLYKNTKTKYFSLGDYFFPDLISELKKAEKFIFMEYFIIEEGKMWGDILQVLTEKVKQGVKVYLLYDDLGSLVLLPSNYYRQMEKLGIHCQPFNKFTPVLSSIFNNRDHRKITVIDGKVGFTGGANLADEYINAIVKYGHWKDSAIKLEGDGVKGLTEMFCLSWNSTDKETLNPADYINSGISYPNQKGFVAPFCDGPNPIYKEKVGKTVYMNIINNAKKYLYISTPYLICDYELMDSIANAAKKGVDVRIIVPHIPDKRIVFDLTRSNYISLIKEGVKIYEYTPGFIHAKNFVSDDAYQVCGTINLDYRSLVHHFECGVFAFKTDSVLQVKKDFEDTFPKCQLMEESTAKLNPIQKIIVDLIRVFSPLF